MIHNMGVGTILASCDASSLQFPGGAVRARGRVPPGISPALVISPRRARLSFHPLHLPCRGARGLRTQAG
jgi:hypothetical protein